VPTVPNCPPAAVVWVLLLIVAPIGGLENQVATARLRQHHTSFQRIPGLLVRVL